MRLLRDDYSLKCNNALGQIDQKTTRFVGGNGTHTHTYIYIYSLNVNVYVCYVYNCYQRKENFSMTLSQYKQIKIKGM